MAQKVALITGGMGGLGTAIAKCLHDDGLKIAINCLKDLPGKDEWLKKTKAQSLDYYLAEADVTNFEDCERMAEKIKRDVGSVDVLVNCAGITRDAQLVKMTKEAWNAVVNVNLNGIFNAVHAVLPDMLEKNWGRIISISSVNGLKGQFGQTNYSATKAGIIGMTKSLAYEVVKKGVTVNAIAPGYIATEMVSAIREDVLQKIIAGIPMGRLGEPAEIGHLVAYLASDKAAYITGSTVSINGGLYMY